MLYSFDDADAPSTHQTQYFEMFGNRGIYHNGWSAVTIHKILAQRRGNRAIRSSTTTRGSFMTAAPTFRKRSMWPRRIRANWLNCSGCS